MRQKNHDRLQRGTFSKRGSLVNRSDSTSQAAVTLGVPDPVAQISGFRGSLHSKLRLLRPLTRVHVRREMISPQLQMAAPTYLPPLMRRESILEACGAHSRDVGTCHCVWLRYLHSGFQSTASYPPYWMLKTLTNGFDRRSRAGS